MCLKSSHCSLTFMFPPLVLTEWPHNHFSHVWFELTSELEAPHFSSELFSAKPHGPLKPLNWHLPDVATTVLALRSMWKPASKYFLNLKTLKVHVMSERIHWQTALWECHWSASSWYSLMFALFIDLHWPESFAFLSSWPPPLLISADVQSLPAVSSPPPLASSSPPPAAAYVPAPPSPERERQTPRGRQRNRKKRALN